MRAKKTERHDMSRQNRGRVSTLRKAMRMERVHAGLRPQSMKYEVEKKPNKRKQEQEQRKVSKVALEMAHEAVAMFKRAFR